MGRMPNGIVEAVRLAIQSFAARGELVSQFGCEGAGRACSLTLGVRPIQLPLVNLCASL